MAQDFDTQLNVKMPKELLARLRILERVHGISPAEALRRLGEEMANFYDQNGWFSFPVKIQPQFPPRMVNVWNLDSEKSYYLVDDKIVAEIMEQLGVSKCFAHTSEHDKIHSFMAFEDHPTHWITLHLWKGLQDVSANGLAFEAQPKSTLSRSQMLKKIKAEALDIKGNEAVFSQLPDSVQKFASTRATAVSGKR